MRDGRICGGPHGFGMPGPHMAFSGFGSLRSLMMGVDFKEDEKALVISIPMPGVTKDDVELILGPDMVVITLKETEESKEEESAGHKEEMYFKPWLFRAGHAMHGTRRFPLPTEIDPDTAKAKLENGILKITADKKNPGKKISVD